MPTLSQMIVNRESSAACKGMEETYLADRNNKEIVSEFKSICAECPVLDTCRDIALVYDAYTNLAGMTPRERRSFRETGAYLDLLKRAAKEGWLNPESAIGSQEDINYALQSVGRVKPALVVYLEVIDFDLLSLETLDFNIATG